MIDKGQHTRFARTLSHTSRFNRIHRHRFFAENCFAVLQSCERHLTMLNGRGDDAYEIDIITSNKGTPVTVYVLNVEFASDFFSMLAVAAGNGDDPGSVAILEAGNLRRAREARANDPDANLWVPHVFPFHSLRLNVINIHHRKDTEESRFFAMRRRNCHRRICLTSVPPLRIVRTTCRQKPEEKSAASS